MSTDTPTTEAETESSTTTPRTGSTTFINTSGGLLTDELVGKLRQRQCRESAVRPETFALPNTEPPEETDLEAEIGDLWDTLRERWDELTMDETLFHMDVSDARTKWILKLFQNLGFEPVFQRENLEADGIEANLSHKGWPDGDIESYGEMEGRTAPIIHTVEPEQKLDEKPENAPRGTKSPHDTLQEFLNASDEHDWAIVTNGLTLRILRDFYHTYTRGYVEFDLENMFTSRNYGDFRALYRLCHSTRFIEPVVADEEEDDVETPLEQLYQVALSTGVKVGQDLQSNVVSAIETLGTGLLNQEVREYLEEGGEEEAKEYYQEILLLVYRLLFLMYAEQRGMMASRDSLYTDEYSITNLREKAETRRSGSDRNSDLWHGLQSTFRLVEKGDDELGVPCYNGMLFDSDRLEWVSESECFNEELLNAIGDLTLIEHEGTRQRISYADLGVEEIGSVYESLLEFTPKLATEVIELEDRTVSHGEFYLDDRGTERKETGSYYTDPGLVRELVQSALKPVVEDRLEDATTIEEQEDALLDITVCDPASGSGAFLIAANNFLAQQLARIRADSDYPPEDQIREARRDVLQHCIYAVDLNPMAVELAKVSLWINSAVENKPLNFLDHHIKCGNSLIGTNSELLGDEFPADAYETSGGRDWHVGNEIRKRVRNENKERSKGSSESSLQQWGAGKEEYVDLAEQLDEIEEEDTEDIEKKKQLYDELRQSDAYQQEKLAYDVWTAAFYWPMDGSTGEYPSPSTIEKIRRNPDPDTEPLQDLKERAEKIADEQRFFHWELEFPEIFSGQERGFDCILGNPPWEKMKVTEKQWFSGRNEEIAQSDSKSHRSGLINQLEEENLDLYKRWQKAKDTAEDSINFVSESGRYPLSGVGDINTYPIFTELSSLELINPRGHTGIVVKTGIATDYYTQDLFAKFIEEKRLVSLHDFVNEEGMFPDVAPPERFCLLTIAGSEIDVDKFEFSFYSTNLEMMRDKNRRYELTRNQIENINPNTKNCPIFESKEDRDVTVRIYQNTPVLINDLEDTNSWGIDYHTIYHMANDDDVFAPNKLEALRQKGYKLDNKGKFSDGTDEYYPLWEAKLFHQYDHRFNTFEGIPKENRFTRKASTKDVSVESKQDSNFEVLPRYWVHESEFKDRKKEIGWENNWTFAFRNITNTTTNFRTAIGTLTPAYPFGHSAPILTFDDGAEQALIFSTLFNSFIFDFALRQSIGGANFTLYILKQLPMPTRQEIKSHKLVEGGSEQPLEDYLIETGLDLCWTSHSLDPLGKSVEPDGDPRVWDQEERNNIRAKTDAAIAKLYGINRADFSYILDDFDILRDREIEEHGEYVTKSRCLNYYDTIRVE
ncbi:Eco57I restriction-modification methylase domain-containing protein [Halobacterium salinarum]|uniref:Eco57I restriction-modification methylase domain-containing protein n=1 Tax=Halobacterium salinarum TaxID=2242 RepID=UPI002557B06B|nr:DNA methyltransferase [Halobacterium salinarum]MDL0145469.1 N-6 DNA methylase [Halobacterium salinarum]